MTTRNDAAPSTFAEAARTTFLYAPIQAVAGVVLATIGSFSGASLFTVMGVIAYLGAAVTGFVGVAGMIRAGQDLLARQHEAAGLAIRRHRSVVAAPQDGAEGAQVAVAGAPHVAPQTPVTRDASDTATSQPSEAQPADIGRVASTDPAAFIELLKSLGILDAARDVQRLYGNGVCASFVNRKCEENDVPDVNLTAEDIPTVFMGNF